MSDVNFSPGSLRNMSSDLVCRPTDIDIIDRNKTTVILNGGEIHLVDNRWDFQYLISGKLKKAILSLGQESNFAYLNNTEKFYNEMIESLPLHHREFDEETLKKYKSDIETISKRYAEEKLVEAITDVVDLVNFLGYSNEEINRVMEEHFLKK